MKLALIIVSLLLLVSLAYNFLHTQESETEARTLRKQVEYNKSLADSISAAYRTLLEQDTIQAVLYANAVGRAESAEKLALKLNQELQHEKAIRRRFSDHELDSLLSAVK